MFDFQISEHNTVMYAQYLVITRNIVYSSQFHSFRNPIIYFSCILYWLLIVSVVDPSTTSGSLTCGGSWTPACSSSRCPPTTSSWPRWGPSTTRWHKARHHGPCRNNVYTCVNKWLKYIVTCIISRCPRPAARSAPPSGPGCSGATGPASAPGPSSAPGQCTCVPGSAPGSQEVHLSQHLGHQ